VAYIPCPRERETALDPSGEARARGCRNVSDPRKGKNRQEESFLVRLQKEGRVDDQLITLKKKGQRCTGKKKKKKGEIEKEKQQEEDQREIEPRLGQNKYPCQKGTGTGDQNFKRRSDG